MFFRLVYDGSLAQAAYLIGCQRTGEAIVIDPERDVDRYLAIAKAEGLRIAAVAETHIHADFLSGAREIAEQTGARVYVSGEGGSEWQYEWLHHRVSGGAYDHEILRNGSHFQVGNIEFETLHTPGHTPEHICFLVTDHGNRASAPMGVVSGDFVFVGDIGRPDLLETAAGVVGAREPAARDLFRSTRRFLELPDFLQVWPAHGAGSACGKALGAVPQSTVGYERRFNPAFVDDEQRFLSYVLEGQPEPPLYFARMKRLNKQGPAVLGGLPQPEQVKEDALAALVTQGAVIVDTRSWAEFKHRHLRGALFIPIDSSFATLAGSWINENDQIALIVSPERREEAVRRLVRVGLDYIVAWSAPSVVASIPEASATSTREIDARSAESLIRDGALILDVRAPAEYREVHIPHAIQATHTVLPSHLEKLPQGKPILVHCKGGGRSARACSLLERSGFNVMNLGGGITSWETGGGKVERS